MAAHFLEQYEPLDVIGNGSFGIIRKVRRKADGMVFARKELNFERMSERDRKQIVAEVNILKDLHHEHIVGYHDRFVDRDAGILYILMEYCGGGDLSSVIKQAAKTGRGIPEESIWAYFMQILKALVHCHHPNGGYGHRRTGSNGGQGDDATRRPQILHRDLKPDNVFLDEAHNVKLGDFGLSKALAQASFANTYVGTPYYMSPELMQEKAYDSKSDIWSLGCLIYELCALKPPFHEAKTHSELSILIRNGRIPPLPRGYSQGLFGVIKAMLNLNPAMRPSAAQLLQHERLDLALKMSETEKMLAQLKSHKTTIVQREREVTHREQSLARKEGDLTALIARKDQDIAQLQQLAVDAQVKLFLDSAVKSAVGRREEELRILVMKREEEVAKAISKREEEIMEAVRRREGEVREAWASREAEVRSEVEQSIQAVEERVDWINRKELELRDREAILESRDLDLSQREVDVSERERNADEREREGRGARAASPPTSPRKLKSLREYVGRNGKPLEEVKNTLAPGPFRRAHTVATGILETPTPITRPSYTDTLPSAMKGVVLTTTGEVVSTPNPNELSHLFNSSPKVGLDFAKIFDSGATVKRERGAERGSRGGLDESSSADEEPPSPSARKEVERRERLSEAAASVGSGMVSSSSSSSSVAQPGVPMTRIRRPSIPSTSASAVAGPSSSGPVVDSRVGELRATATVNGITRSSSVPSVLLPSPRLTAPAVYDHSDQENLPSPFLKRVVPSTSSSSLSTVSSRASSSIVSSVASSTSTGLTSAQSSSSIPEGRSGASGSGSDMTTRINREGPMATRDAPSAVGLGVNGGNGRAQSKKRPSTGNLLRAVAAANSAGRARKGSVDPTSAGVAEEGRIPASVSEERIAGRTGVGVRRVPGRGRVRVCVC
ncbi:kinase-like protein [Coprinellus micaceus]|uniref:non-specific serine/threonine protein kinase n=1 Tax=Coprinellus micaceus TaxID=71717 RepID=A0A4Y7T478_COPMI|nr:kinase-like protein [Coprinellus micaceus]